METIEKYKQLKSKLLFKSYYVVWKHTGTDNIVMQEPRGLNRTMQYGNLFFGKKKITKKNV